MSTSDANPETEMTPWDCGDNSRGSTGAWKVAALLVAFKCLYFAVLLFCLRAWPSMNLEVFNRVDVRWPQQGLPTFESHLATWDAAHYLRLAKQGYQSGDPSCAFYPLWPCFIQLASSLTGGRMVLAGLVMSNACSVAGLSLFYHGVCRLHGKRVGGYALASLALFPGSIFFSLVYSESLFLLLAMTIWLGLETRNQFAVWCGAFLLPLTRAIGVFACIPIAHAFLWPRITGWFGGTESGLAWEDADSPSIERRKSSDVGVLLLLLLSCAPILGFGSYLFLMHSWTGNAVEGFDAQRHWGRHSILNLVDLPHFVTGFFRVTSWHAFNGSLLDRLVFLLHVFFIPVVWRAGRGLWVWDYILGILPAMSGVFTSYTRFASCCFPLFIGMAIWVATAKRGTGKWLFFAAFGILHGVLLWRCVNFRWAG